MIAPMLTDHRHIGIAQHAEPFQVRSRQIANKPAITSNLLIRQKLDRHHPGLADQALTGFSVPILPLPRPGRFIDEDLPRPQLAAGRYDLLDVDQHHQATVTVTAGAVAQLRIALHHH